MSPIFEFFHLELFLRGSADFFFGCHIIVVLKLNIDLTSLGAHSGVLSKWGLNLSMKYITEGILRTIQLEMEIPFGSKKHFHLNILGLDLC